MYASMQLFPSSQADAFIHAHVQDSWVIDAAVSSKISSIQSACLLLATPGLSCRSSANHGHESTKSFECNGCEHSAGLAQTEARSKAVQPALQNRLQFQPTMLQFCSLQLQAGSSLVTGLLNLT